MCKCDCVLHITHLLGTKQSTTIDRRPKNVQTCLPPENETQKGAQAQPKQGKNWNTQHFNVSLLHCTDATEPGLAIGTEK